MQFLAYWDGKGFFSTHSETASFYGCILKNKIFEYAFLEFRTNSQYPFSFNFSMFYLKISFAFSLILRTSRKVSCSFFKTSMKMFIIFSRLTSPSPTEFNPQADSLHGLKKGFHFPWEKKTNAIFVHIQTLC